MGGSGVRRSQMRSCWNGAKLAEEQRRAGTVCAVRSQRRRVSERALDLAPVCASASLSAIAALAGQPLIATGLLVLGVAMGLSSVPSRALFNIPAAALLVLAGALVLGETAALVSIPVASTPLACRGLLIGSALLVMVVTARRPGRAGKGLPPDRAAWGSALPSVVLLALGGVLWVLPTQRQVQWFLEGDNLRHLIFAAQTWGDGNLDYSADPYPRGWHMLLALLWGADNASWKSPGLISLLEAIAAATWLLAAVLALATGLLTRALLRYVGVSGHWYALLPLIASSVMLTPAFLGDYLALGFQNSLVGALVLATVSVEILHAPGQFRSLAVTSAGVMVVANAWQILLPVAVLVMASAGVVYLRGGKDEPRPERRRLRIALAAGSAAVAAAPGIVAVTVQTGLAHGAEAGVVAPLPAMWLVLGLASAVVLGSLTWRTIGPPTVAAALGLTATTGFVLAAFLGISPLRYYPSKTLWHACALGVPIFFAVAGWALTRSRWSDPRSLPVAALTAAALAVTIPCLAAPWAALRGSWSAVHAERVLAVVTTPGVAEAQVVWTEDREDDTVSRILLDFYQIPHTRVRTVQHPTSVADDCTLLTASTAPTVVSDQPPTAVRARYSCVVGVRVIPVTRG